MPRSFLIKKNGTTAVVPGPGGLMMPEKLELMHGMEEDEDEDMAIEVDIVGDSDGEGEPASLPDSDHSVSDTPTSTDSLSQHTGRHQVLTISMASSVTSVSLL